ncbi:MAG: hypothetical protein KatS3mg027_1996 [Bacteroidia bacterium]|nr:MAG: hypothetical protein KatS3mg027_1996 [Bacteroidia bacterium]
MPHLISFLGTGSFHLVDNKREYRTAKYQFNNQIQETKYVSLFLAQQLKADKIIFIGTFKSMWEQIYIDLVPPHNINEPLLNQLLELHNKKHSDPYNPQIFSELEQQINQHSHTKIKIIIVNYGINQDEIHQNIQIIYQQLLDEFIHHPHPVQLHIDTTHSFRSLPLVLLQVIQYFSWIHNDKIQIKGIYYGMLEVINELGYAPIIDLSSIWNIQQWTQAAYDFQNYGNGYLLSQLINNTNPSEANLIRQFSENLNLNLIFHFKQNIQQLRGILNKEYPSLGKNIIPNVLSGFLQRFKGDLKNIPDWKLQLELAKWQFENKRYGLAVIILYEAIFSYICYKENLNPLAYNDREIAKKKFYPKKNYKSIRDIISKNKIDDIRNGIAHQLEKQITPDKAIKNIQNAILEIEKILL